MAAWRNRLGAATICAAFAACGTGTNVVYDIYRDSSYSIRELGYGSRKGALLVETGGDTFGLDRSGFSKAIASYVPANALGVSTRFTADPGPETDPLYRYVLVFGRDRGVIRDQVCLLGQPAAASAAPAPSKIPHPVIISAAFCRGSSALTSAIGEIGQAKGIDDPALKELIAQLSFEIFPINNSLNRGGGGPIF